MLKNYVLIALRSFRKNYIYSLINIGGMAVGLSGIIITIMLFRYEYGFDSNHANTENIFRVNCERQTEGEMQKWGIVPNALAPNMAEVYPGVGEFCRYGFDYSFIVQFEDIVHHEEVAFADPNFFELFSFTSSGGNLSAFYNKNTAVVTRAFAQKYFGDENPVGKILTLRNSGEIFDQFTVGAVVEKPQKNSSFQFGIIIQHANILDLYGIEDSDWSTDFRNVLYVAVDQSVNSERVERALQQLVSTHNEIVDSWEIDRIYLMPFRKQMSESNKAYAFTTWGGLPVSALYGSVIMNGLILLIACFNFTNTSMVYANKRLLEVGIRRTFGGYKWQIFKQFFVESFIMCLLALVLSVELANIWIGLMNRQWPIEIQTYVFDDFQVSFILLGLLMIVALVAGAYPAYYASRFQPTEILKGKLKLLGSNNFSRILLTWQFGFSVMAIFSGIVLTQNARFQKTLDWGFNNQNAIVLPLEGEAKYSTLESVLESHDKVREVSGTVQNLGYSTLRATIELDGIEHDTRMIFVGDDYMNTLNCEILEGRFFHRNSKFDISESVLVNEKFVHSFGIENPLEAQIYRDNKKFQIVGVVKDFMPYGLFSPIMPVVIHAAPEEQYEHLVFTAKDQSDLSELMSVAKGEWKALFPNLPFEGFYMSENAAEAFDTNQGILVQFGINAIFALFLSVTGLYSVVSLNINKRTKEIGIRKVFGASVAQVMKVINREFIFILAIAVLIGSIGGLYFMKKFLSDIFIYHTNIGFFTFAVSAIVILLMTALTSGVKVYKATQKNPTDSLRCE